MRSRLINPYAQVWALDVSDLDIDGECRAIEAAYVIGTSAAPAGKSDRRMALNAQLRVGLYKLVLRALASDAMDQLAERARQPWELGSEDGNPFQVGMVAIFVNAPQQRSSRQRGPSEWRRPPSETERTMCLEAWHAYRHLVPPALLSGFIGQCGVNTIKARAVGDDLEPGFEEWVILRLATARSHHIGPHVRYPAEVTAAADRVAAEMIASKELLIRRRAEALRNVPTVRRNDEDGWD
jgi:hypothetical protein